jgi:hypothetical protein
MICTIHGEAALALADALTLTGHQRRSMQALIDGDAKHDVRVHGESLARLQTAILDSYMHALELAVVLGCRDLVRELHVPDQIGTWDFNMRNRLLRATHWGTLPAIQDEIHDQSRRMHVLEVATVVEVEAMIADIPCPKCGQRLFPTLSDVLAIGHVPVSA